jgi:hypothetical protein
MVNAVRLRSPAISANLMSDSRAFRLGCVVASATRSSDAYDGGRVYGNNWPEHATKGPKWQPH